MASTIEEATKKAGVVWVHVGDRAQALWHVWAEGAAWVLTGPGEQPDPGLAGAGRVVVQVGSALRWDAAVARVAPGSEEWTRLVPLLLAGRLHLPDRDTAAERWAATCAVYRLTPNPSSKIVA
jgi:hypothetical protein